MGATSLLTKMSICKTAQNVDGQITSKDLAVVDIYNLIQQPIELAVIKFLLF